MSNKILNPIPRDVLLKTFNNDDRAVREIEKIILTLKNYIPQNISSISNNLDSGLSDISNTLNSLIGSINTNTSNINSVSSTLGGLTPTEVSDVSNNLSLVSSNLSNASSSLTLTNTSVSSISSSLNRLNSISTISASLSLTLANRHILIDSSTSAVTATLPNASQAIGLDYYIHGYNITNSATVNTVSSQLIKLIASDITDTRTITSGDVIYLVSAGNFWKEF